MFEILNSISSIPMDVVQFLAKYNAQDFCYQTRKIWSFVGQIIKVLQIVIPVIIILLGTIDLGKAVMAGDDKKVKEAQKMLLMRIIYGVAIFFVITIVRVIFGMLDNADTGSICFNCISEGKC